MDDDESLSSGRLCAGIYERWKMEEEIGDGEKKEEEVEEWRSGTFDVILVVWLSQSLVSITVSACLRDKKDPSALNREEA